MIALLSSLALAEPPPLTSEMHARFEALTATRDAIIAGSLKDAASAVEPLCASDPLAPFPKEWSPMLRRVEVEAKRVQGSKDLTAASTAVAKVAMACAECHTLTGDGPLDSEAPGIPPQKWVEEQNMPLHRWAIDWMWLGLLANDAGAWERGADELDSKPLAMMFDSKDAPAEMKDLEQRVYALASEALTTEKQADRAALYGRIVSTCSQCHQMRPKP